MNLHPAHPPNRRHGFTWLELLVVVIVVVFLAGLFLPGRSLRTSRDGRHIQCLNNLKMLGLGLRIFATDHDGQFPWAVPGSEGGTLEEIADEQRIWRHVAVLSNELNTPKVLLCPKDPRFDKIGSKTLVFGPPPDKKALRFGSNEHLSYFLYTGANAEVLERIVAGDRNLTRNGTPVQGKVTPSATDIFQFTRPGHHDHVANLLQAEGSVLIATASRAKEFFADSFRNAGTNRFNELLIP
jgi:type II secretory pathway pseudopilin PulG